MTDYVYEMDHKTYVAHPDHLAETKAAVRKHNKRLDRLLVACFTVVALSLGASFFGVGLMPQEVATPLPEDFGVKFPETITFTTDGGNQVTAELIKGHSLPYDYDAGAEVFSVDDRSRVVADEPFVVQHKHPDSSYLWLSHAPLKPRIDALTGAAIFSGFTVDDPFGSYEVVGAPLPDEVKVTVDGDLREAVSFVGADGPPYDGTKLTVIFDLAAMQELGLTALEPLGNYHAVPNEERYWWITPAGILAAIVTIIAACIVDCTMQRRFRTRMRVELAVLPASLSDDVYVSWNSATHEDVYAGLSLLAEAKSIRASIEPWCSLDDEAIHSEREAWMEDQLRTSDALRREAVILLDKVSWTKRDVL